MVAAVASPCLDVIGKCKSKEHKGNDHKCNKPSGWGKGDSDDGGPKNDGSGKDGKDGTCNCGSNPPDKNGSSNDGPKNNGGSGCNRR